MTSEISNEIQARFVKVFIMSLSFFSGIKKKKKNWNYFFLSHEYTINYLSEVTSDAYNCVLFAFKIWNFT